MRKIKCWLLHRRAWVFTPGGMHCYDAHCEACDRKWLVFE